MDQTMSQAIGHVSLINLTQHLRDPHLSPPLHLLIVHKSVYVGLRDIDAPERKILREQGIKCFSMHEVDKYGIGKVMEMALDHVNPTRDRPTHLSFDVDALDPSVAPSKYRPLRGGWMQR